MIHSLRQRHRIMILSLVALLPALFAMGIVARNQSTNGQTGLSRRLALEPVQKEVWTRDDLWSDKPIRTRLLSLRAGRAKLAVQLVPLGNWLRPDSLVYWVPGSRTSVTTLPDDAFFLGNLEAANSVPLLLPDEAAAETGSLLLYSLADQELVSVSTAFNAR